MSRKRNRRLVLRMLIVLIVSMIFSSCSKDGLYLKLQDARQNNQVIEAVLSFENLSNEPIVTYTSLEEAICFGLVKMTFRSSSNEFEWYPCTEIVDLEEIILTPANSKKIDRMAVYKKKLVMDIASITPSIPPGDYEFVVMIDYSEVKFESSQSGIFKGRLTTPVIKISIK